MSSTKCWNSYFLLAIYERNVWAVWNELKVHKVNWNELNRIEFERCCIEFITYCYRLFTYGYRLFSLHANHFDRINPPSFWWFFYCRLKHRQLLMVDHRMVVHLKHLALFFHTELLSFLYHYSLQCCTALYGLTSCFTCSILLQE